EPHEGSLKGSRRPTAGVHLFWPSSEYAVGTCDVIPAGECEGFAVYVAEIEKWRQGREARLKAEDGWLSLTGLSWLKDGTNIVGSDPRSDVVLPAGKAPARLGTIELRTGKAHWKPEAGAAVLINGKAAGESDVKSDAA